MAMARAKAGDSGSPEPALGYEEARAALAEVVAALESGETTLEEALALWERGEEYARVSEAWLSGAQERLSQESEGTPGSTTPSQEGAPSD